MVASNIQTDDVMLVKLGQDESEVVRSFLSRNPPIFAFGDRDGRR
jgi:hypothetical protein